MNTYLNYYNDFKETYVYNFTLGNGGIGDYIKYFLILLKHCMDNNIKIKKKINNIEIEKYIKLKHDIFNIEDNEILELKNVIIKDPNDLYDISNNSHVIDINDIFYIDSSVKDNVKNILTTIPDEYISIHLRLGDYNLETEQQYIACPWDNRDFSEKKLFEFIESNLGTNIIFFCDNKSYKSKIKQIYSDIFVTNVQPSHTSYNNTSDKQVLDTITEFYLLSCSKLIYSPSKNRDGKLSGFSKIASLFNKVKILY